MEIIIGMFFVGYILFDDFTNKEDSKPQPNNKPPTQDSNSNSNSNSNSQRKPNSSQQSNNRNNNNNNNNNKAEFNTKCPHCGKDIIIKLYER